MKGKQVEKSHRENTRLALQNYLLPWFLNKKIYEYKWNHLENVSLIFWCGIY